MMRGVRLMVALLLATTFLAGSGYAIRTSISPGMRGPAAVVFGTQGEHVSGRITIRQGRRRVSHHSGNAL